MFGLPKAQIAKLQRVQNAAARLILGIGKFSHITPALYELHWLPVSLRIDYKILLLTFKCIYGLAPTYLSDLISIKSNSLYNLRSTGKLLLDHPKGKMLTTLGARSFSAAAPKLWNELPVELRQATSLDSFKSREASVLYCPHYFQAPATQAREKSRYRVKRVPLTKNRWRAPFVASNKEFSIIPMSSYDITQNH